MNVCKASTHDVNFIETIYKIDANTMPFWRKDLSIYGLWHLQPVPLATSRWWYVLESIWMARRCLSCQQGLPVLVMASTLGHTRMWGTKDLTEGQLLIQWCCSGGLKYDTFESLRNVAAGGVWTTFEQPSEIHLSLVLLSTSAVQMDIFGWSGYKVWEGQSLLRSGCFHTEIKHGTVTGDLCLTGKEAHLFSKKSPTKSGGRLDLWRYSATQSSRGVPPSTQVFRQPGDLEKE